MINSRKNEAKTDLDLYNYIKESKKYSEKWLIKKTSNSYVQECLDVSSKSGKGFRGEPDLIYLNEKKRLLILVENKPTIKNHISKNENSPKSYAVDGIKHYLSHFFGEKIDTLNPTIRKYFEDWSIVGIAFSGDINDEYNHLISTFILANEQIKKIETNEILDEEDYLAFFENIDLENISKNISKSSSEINRMLRTLDSQKRPVLLSALMICLYDKGDISNDFKKSYSNWTITTIIRNIPTTIEDILLNEGIDKDKIDVLVNELTFIKTDNDLLSSDILKKILNELESNVIPLFNKRTNYDIIGKFYEEFLRYAGVANVKKGIVLTPSHITQLFTELVEIKNNDVILDTCCGTGAFLISGMNKLVHEIELSQLANKQEKIKKLKQNQLIGFEKSSTMYSLAISNMLFRGDGKSRIFNIDAFSEKAEEILKKLRMEDIRPSIGFINPPYGGKDNQTNPTKKEIQFLETLLDSVSSYGVIIAPLSTYFKDEIERNRILSKHTLKAVINMPGELFQPNAATHTAIAIFKTNLPHNNKNVTFYDLNDDGFVLSKNRGRTDVLNKWTTIKKTLLEKLKNPDKYENQINLVSTPILLNDEWIIQAHSKTDYSHLSEKSFIKSIKQHIIFSTKLKLDLLNKDIDEITFLEILNDTIQRKPANDKIKFNFNMSDWKEFSFSEVFYFERGKRLIKLDQNNGDIAYISSTKVNNGIDNYITPPTYMTIYKNAMTINNSGSVGYLFYHTYDFVCSDHCTVIYLKDQNTTLNNYISIFLKPIIESIRPKFNFAREISDARLEREKISLPVDKNGNPDFIFMETYIKSLPYSGTIV
ncbi:N-6 DNA methylase [Mucilaginibacter psychrotolerans]|uniref:site-specific DNA-methyltransferase (adenine-specific) n=1 Tax=Mucilaginibacter psychrotolerans TaxID=1524096 RepID=A0A4Y8S5H3_9SPHI|nr:N-6 DNA methylase [Mucilaginibacter psychrotolerans]TFF34142.1 type II restriction endonuclease subunit M [Mucilaginibacter psychrotolerans]